MKNSNEKVDLKNTFIDTENRLTTVRGEGYSGMGKKIKGLRKKKDTDCQRERGWGDGRGQRVGVWCKKRLDFG